MNKLRLVYEVNNTDQPILYIYIFFFAGFKSQIHERYKHILIARRRLATERVTVVFKSILNLLDENTVQQIRILWTTKPRGSVASLSLYIYV